MTRIAPDQARRVAVTLQAVAEQQPQAWAAQLLGMTPTAYRSWLDRYRGAHPGELPDRWPTGTGGRPPRRTAPPVDEQPHLPGDTVHVGATPAGWVMQCTPCRRTLTYPTRRRAWWVASVHAATHQLTFRSSGPTSAHWVRYGG